MRKGFTILELMVASLLLSMLVVILTMVFNQSSIAWRTGVAGVVELGETRMQIGTFHDVEDDVLPGLGETEQPVNNRAVNYRTVSIFRHWGGGTINPNDVSTDAPGRLYDRINWQTAPNFNATDNDVCMGNFKSINGGSSRGGNAFAVGVRSAGPDRKFDTEDDISTFPSEVN